MVIFSGTGDLIRGARRVSSHRFLRFAMRHELSRGTVDETVELEHKEIGEPDEEAAVYR